MSQPKLTALITAANQINQQLRQLEAALQDIETLHIEVKVNGYPIKVSPETPEHVRLWRALTDTRADYINRQNEYSRALTTIEASLPDTPL